MASSRTTDSGRTAILTAYVLNRTKQCVSTITRVFFISFVRGQSRNDKNEDQTESFEIHCPKNTGQLRRLYTMSFDQTVPSKALTSTIMLQLNSSHYLSKASESDDSPSSMLIGISSFQFHFYDWVRSMFDFMCEHDQCSIL